MPKISPQIRYNRYLEKIQDFYQVNRIEALQSLYEAYESFLCVEELEPFIIPLKEYKLNKKHQGF